MDTSCIKKNSSRMLGKEISQLTSFQTKQNFIVIWIAFFQARAFSMLET